MAVVTAATVVLVGVKQGIQVALVFSLLDHVRHGYRPHTAVLRRDPADDWRMKPVEPGKMAEPGLVVYWFAADLYYTNAAHFGKQARRLVTQPVRWLVVDAGAITDVDYSAAATIKELQQHLSKRGVVWIPACAGMTVP